MARYMVTFSQYHIYYVDAKDEEEAEDIAYKDFEADMRSPIANTFYDEVEVEPEDDDEDDEEVD